MKKNYVDNEFPELPQEDFERKETQIEYGEENTPEAYQPIREFFEQAQEKHDNPESSYSWKDIINLWNGDEDAPHNFDWENARTDFGDCTHPEVVHVVCLDCGLEKEFIYGTAIGHLKAEAVIENRTEEGYDSVVYCAVCGEKLSTTHHTHVAGEKQEISRTDPDCTNEGSSQWKVVCTDCKEEIGNGTDVLPKTDHTPAETVTENYVDSDCETVGGYDTVTYCSVCGDEISRVHTEIPKKDHTPAETVTENYVDSDCETVGGYDTVTYCSVCGDEISRVHTEISKKDHTPTAKPVIENIHAATCTEDGSRDLVFYCTECHGEVSRETETLPATGHSFNPVNNLTTEPEVTYCDHGCGTSLLQLTCDENGAVSFRLDEDWAESFGEFEGDYVIRVFDDGMDEGRIDMNQTEGILDAEFYAGDEVDIWLNLYNSKQDYITIVSNKVTIPVIGDIVLP